VLKLKLPKTAQAQKTNKKIATRQHKVCVCAPRAALIPRGSRRWSSGMNLRM
jgi:hypothetical protein